MMMKPSTPDHSVTKTMESAEKSRPSGRVAAQRTASPSKMRERGTKFFGFRRWGFGGFRLHLDGLRLQELQD